MVADISTAVAYVLSLAMFTAAIDSAAAGNTASTLAGIAVVLDVGLRSSAMANGQSLCGSVPGEITDSNAAFFDAANGFRGCLAGLHEVLRRQGLMEALWCLDEDETLSPGQLAEIDRVYRLYPHLNDDAFVASHRDEWLRD